MEFYRKFWPIIGDSFSKCANECFKKGEISLSQKPAIITLIEKKGEDHSLLENWRPISLLNVGAKIISKVIAGRIKNVLPHIIHHNQTGFIKDCCNGERGRSIPNIIELTVEENFRGAMIFIDFQKAFDNLEWNYLLNCVQYFDFGLDFI